MVGRLNPNWIVPTAPRGTSDNRAASTAFVNPGGGAGSRIVLPAGAYPGGVVSGVTYGAIFYVATNGADNPISSGGGTAGAPFLTPTYAATQLANAVDFGGQAVLLQAVAGHAGFTTGLHLKPWVGGGSFAYDGGGGSITTTNEHSIDSVSGPLPGSATIQNVAISASGAVSGLAVRGLYIISSTTCFIGSGVSFGAVAGPHIQPTTGAFIQFLANYSITGNALAHWLLFDGTLAFESPAITITLTGTPAFSLAFVYCTSSGAVQMDAPPSFTGSATGPRYAAVLNGVINTGGRGPNYFPGNAAGSTNSGGQYV